ncbi:MAG: tetratricopeptide repeat protein [Myxococcaceae bacterium]
MRVTTATERLERRMQQEVAILDRARREGVPSTEKHIDSLSTSPAVRGRLLGALAAYAAGENPENRELATGLLERASQLSPDAWSIPQQGAELCMKWGDWNGALVWLEKASQQRATLPAIPVQQAVCLCRLGRIDEAERRLAYAVNACNATRRDTQEARALLEHARACEGSPDAFAATSPALTRVPGLAELRAAIERQNWAAAEGSLRRLAARSDELPVCVLREHLRALQGNSNAAHDALQRLKRRAAGEMLLIVHAALAYAQHTPNEELRKLAPHLSPETSLVDVRVTVGRAVASRLVAQLESSSA